nr:vinorine synthase [Quercus suber]
MTQIVSRTCIKPSSPTPHNLKTFKLSLLDQLSPPIHGNTTFFFPTDVQPLATTNPNLEFSRKSQLLQQSISDTLTRFYPLAGRLLDASTIDYNDDGGFFIEARCDSPLSDFLSKPNFETLDQFLPTTDPETLELPKGSMWLIKFSCGGTTVSVSLSQKIIDIASLLTLLKSWTETCRGLSEPILPNFTGFSLLPPKEIPGMSASVKISGDKFKIGRFVISASKIAELREKVISMIGREQHYPSRVELVLAKLWKCNGSGCQIKNRVFQAHRVVSRSEPPR